MFMLMALSALGKGSIQDGLDSALQKAGIGDDIPEGQGGADDSQDDPNVEKPEKPEEDSDSVEWKSVYDAIMKESVEDGSDDDLYDAFNKQPNADVQQGMQNFDKVQQQQGAPNEAVEQLKQMIKTAVYEAVAPLKDQSIRTNFQTQLDLAAKEHGKELLVKYQDAIRRKIQMVPGLTVTEAARLVIPTAEYVLKGKKEAARLIDKQVKGLKSARGGAAPAGGSEGTPEKLDGKGKKSKDLWREALAKGLDKFKI